MIASINGCNIHLNGLYLYMRIFVLKSIDESPDFVVYIFRRGSFSTSVRVAASTVSRRIYDFGRSEA